MLTCKTVTPERAVDYFLQGYYLEGTSRWVGKGAEKLGLQGAVSDEQVFTNIVNGLSPDGSQELSKRKIESIDRRAALDCTFSAPKSVSLTALVGGDERLIAAHHLAVEKTLALMQERYAHTRVTIGQERQIVNTGNLVVAQFDHIETRELDPHMHTHCLVMNMTQVDNGSWYSHLNEAIYTNKKFLGMVYQNYLALEVQKLGYLIEPKGHGQFDIKGYTEEQLMDFSKRRQQILAAVGPNSSWAQREKAWDATRKRKEKVKPEELKAKWLSEAAALGITFVQPLHNHLQPEPLASNSESQEQETRVEQKLRAIDPKSLDDAIAHCSERKVAFRLEEVEQFILNEGRPCDITHLEPLLKESPELLRIQDLDGIRYTTQSALQRELATIRLMQQGQGQVPAIAHKEEIAAYLSGKTLTDGQLGAVLMTTTTTDQVTAWQGVAGAGKTYALKELQQIASKQGVIIKGYAPSSEAAKVLGSEVGISSNTVASLLAAKQPDQPQLNQIWIVDEAGLLSAKDAHALLKRAFQEQARVILVGDTRQLSAVEAGNPFKSLQQAGMTTAYLEQSLRQRTPELKLAVDLIASGNVLAGFTQLETNGCIKEVTALDKVKAIATEYMATKPEERVKTLVLAGTNAERLEITQAIRALLKSEGSLGQEATTRQLKALDLTTVQMKYTHHFEVGDVVMPTRSYKRRGLEKGELYQVVGKTQDRLTLQSNSGGTLEVDTGFSKAVYKQHQIAIAVGDLLKWTKNDRNLGRRNGQEFTVTGIEGNIAQIQYPDSGHSETINLAQAQHLDYALVSTTYSSQGKTADRVLIAADYTIGKESFYVAVSRAKNSLKLYTEDKDKLLFLAQQSKAKETVLEVLRQHVREQVATEPVSRTSQPVKRSTPATHNKVPLKHEAPSSNPPSIEAQSKAARLIKHVNENSNRVKASNQPSTPPPIKHPVKKQNAPAANRKLPKLPDWLTIGKRVHCQGRGWGEVQAVSGIKLVLKLDSGDSHHLLGWPDAVKAKLVTPDPTEAFWIPDIPGVPPLDIEPEHWRELVEGSAIHPKIAARNFKSLQQDPVEQEHESWGHLMYSDKLERTNTGRLSAGMLKRYDHISAGGWWCSAGVDSRSFQNLQPGQKPKEHIWGCYKPNAPRENPEKPGKVIKYEHPPKTELSIFLLDVPHEMQERIYEKAEVNPSPSDRASGFWYCVWKHNVPITITEGAKKAASLLSQGHAAIGLPGIYAGYRSKDEQGQEIKARLMDELAVFGTKDREIKFCFDFETRPDTKRNIDIAISRTGSLLERQGAKVSVVTLPGPEKGVDDLLVTQGPLTYEKLDREAPRLSAWRLRNKAQQKLLPEPAGKLDLESRKEQLKAKLAPKHQTSTPIPSSSLSSVEPPTHELDITQHQENSDERPDFHQSQPTNRADIVRPTSTRFSPNQPPIGAVRDQPHQFATGPGELSEAISGAVEQQEQERIAGATTRRNKVGQPCTTQLMYPTNNIREEGCPTLSSLSLGAVESLSRSLRDCQPSVDRTEKLRTAIAQLHTAITAELQCCPTKRDILFPWIVVNGKSVVLLQDVPLCLGKTSELGQQINRRHLNAIADYIEHEVVQSAPALIEALEELSKNLNKLLTPDRARAVKQLDTAIYDAIQQDAALAAKQRDCLQIQNKPITIQPEIIWLDVAGKEDLSPKQLDVATRLKTLEQQQLVYRQRYQELQKQVRQYPGFSSSSNWEVDVGVALLVFKESSDHNEVGRVLAQSDQLKEWKASLPNNEYMAKGRAYIHQVYEQAQDVREVRALQQQKRDSGLEL